MEVLNTLIKHQYINLPGILAERVYSRYDKTGKGYITAKEFIETSIFFFSPQFDDKVKIVFELFDFNNDGKIDAEDIRTLMSHMPLQKMVRNYLLFNRVIQSSPGLIRTLRL